MQPLFYLSKRLRTRLPYIFTSTFSSFVSNSVSFPSFNNNLNTVSKMTLMKAVDELIEKVNSWGNESNISSNNDIKESKNDKKEKISQNGIEEKKYDEEDKDTSIRLKTPKGTRDYGPIETKLRNEMFDIIKRNFIKYGGEFLETPVFELKSILMDKYGEECTQEKLIYDLDPSQESLDEQSVLRYDLTVPLCRYIAMNRKNILNGFNAARIGRVYRRDTPRMDNARYREFWQCDLDIVRTSIPNNKLDLVLDDCDIIRCVIDILYELDFGEFYIKINNRKLLDVILDICGVTSDKFGPISSAIDKMDKKPWNEIKDEMILKGVSSECADMIKEFISLNGKPSDVLNELKNNSKIKNSKLYNIALEAINEFELLLKYISLFSNNNYNYINLLNIDMSMVRGLEYYTGIILEGQLGNKELAAKIGSISGGGRYDKLVNSFVPSQEFPCVGASIGFERIFFVKCLINKININKSGNLLQIIICEVGNKNSKPLIEERLRLKNYLENNSNYNICIQNKIKPSFRDQIEYSENRDIPWMIILGENEINNNKLNIRRLILLNDIIKVKSKDKKLNDRKFVINKIDTNNKTPLFYIKPLKLDENELKKQKNGKIIEYRITKKEISQIYESKADKCFDLQFSINRDSVIEFFKQVL